MRTTGTALNPGKLVVGEETLYLASPMYSNSFWLFLFHSFQVFSRKNLPGTIPIASGGPADVSRAKLLKKFDQNFL
jgi:hypothetical protein